MDFDPLILGAIILAGLGLNLSAKLLVEKINPPRLVCWVLILLPLVGVHFLMISQPVFARVIGICIILLLGMKILVYMEWLKSGGKLICIRRWAFFSFLWFGMEPRAWVGRRKKLEWRSHGKWGIYSICLGALGLSFVSYYQIAYFPLAFVFMSMMFHFGVLRLNTMFWRMVGFPVRTLFRNPLVSAGFADFWGARWNLAYSQMMARAVQRPLVPLVGKKAALFSVFLLSGLFHELAITLPAMAGYGLPTLFFTFNGLAVLVETKGVWLRYACLICLIVGLPVLFPSSFVEQVIWPIQNLWKLWISVLL